MKTSEYLQLVQEHYLEGKEFFLCLVAAHYANLDRAPMRLILLNHGITLDGAWHPDMQPIRDSSPSREYDYLDIFVRGLFLHLAIAHYQRLGD